METNLPFYITNVESSGHKSLNNEELKIYKRYFNSNSVYHKTIFFINADQISLLYNRHKIFFINRYNAAVFFWEFDDYFYFPDAFKVLDEAIAFTDFIATAIRKSAPDGFKVTKLSFPFVKNWEITQPVQTIRNRYHIPQNDFVFFFNFDFHSIYERKNPAAILQAMDLAFNEQDEVTLVLKTIHAEKKGQSFQKFQALFSATRLNAKVILINESLERNEMMSLINASDSYISLHRSEGLGLGMMEAMSMGKPVIATAFGGNLDFMDTENSLLVGFEKVPLQQDEFPYKKGWLWANPNIEMAAGYMQKLYANREYAKMLGEKAQSFIEAKYNSTMFSKEIRAWLQEE